MICFKFMKRIGLLGAGTVGSAFSELVSKYSKDAEVHKVLVRDLKKTRHQSLSEATFTNNPKEVLSETDILVELIGGTTLAGDLLLETLATGKPVITANKAVLAERWEEFKPFITKGLVYFEASVMAGTPAIEPLTGSLRGSQPLEMHGILNGTCNYIIDQLEQGKPYEKALKEAQELGYAEADPSLDVGGFDTAHKLTLLARLSFDPDIAWQTVKANTKGIDALTPLVVSDALQQKGCIRLVASVYPEAEKWQAKVRPVFLPQSHPLAAAASNRNALHFKGEAVGDILITGAGAGAMPTASGVFADLIKVLAEDSGPKILKSAISLPVKYQTEVLKEIL